MKKLIALAIVAGFFCVVGVGCSGDTAKTVKSTVKSATGEKTGETKKAS